MNRALELQVEWEYGVAPDVGGARAWARISSTRPARAIETAAAYVGVCRRLARRCPPPENGGPPWLEGEGRLDGRLVTVGFQHVPPSEWIRGERRDGREPRTLADFAAWWTSTQGRPGRVGSDYNVAPELAYQLWAAGPAVRRVLRGVPVAAWPHFASQGRLHPRNLRRASVIGRAAARSSARECGWQISARALAALGRCCPEMQRAALQSAEQRATSRVRGVRCSTTRAACSGSVGSVVIGVGGICRLWSDPPGWQALLIGGTRYVLVQPCAYGGHVFRVAAVDRAGNWTLGYGRGNGYTPPPPTCTGRGIAAIGGSTQFATSVTVRVRDLDWAAAAAVQSAIQRGGDRARLRAAYRTYEDREGHTVVSRRFLSLLDRLAGTSWSTLCTCRVAYLAPAYPRVGYDIALQLFLGESPVEVSDGALSRREAHEWLTSGGEAPPAEWLVRRLTLGDTRIRSATVARWLLDVHRRGGWGGLTRERTVHGPAGVVVTVRYLDRIDEIQDCDLVRGVRTSVEDTFRAASERVGEAWLTSARGDHRVIAGVPRGWRLYPCMRVLTTPAALVREGEDMHHCVGGYAHAVESGQSVVVSLSVAGQRSTAELTPTGRVLQHHGPFDGTPHPLCRRVLGRFVERRVGGRTS